MVISRLTLLAVLPLVTTLSSAQTVDEIVARHVEARGGREKLQAIQSLRFTGRAESHDCRDLVEASKENRLPRIPREQAVNSFSSLSDNLGGDADKRVDERFELHPDHRLLLSLVLSRPPSLFGE